MDLFILIPLLIVLFLITWIVIAVNAAPTPSFPIPELPYPRSKSFWEAETDSLKAQNRSLREEIEYINRNCRYRHQPPFMGNHCCNHVCAEKILMPSVKEQEFADLLVKGQKSAEQLAKDLKLKN